jgi:hypothetical protein
LRYICNSEFPLQISSFGIDKLIMILAITIQWEVKYIMTLPIKKNNSVRFKVLDIHCHKYHSLSCRTHLAAILTIMSVSTIIVVVIQSLFDSNYFWCYYCYFHLCRLFKKKLLNINVFLSFFVKFTIWYFVWILD